MLQRIPVTSVSGFLGQAPPWKLHNHSVRSVKISIEDSLRIKQKDNSSLISFRMCEVLRIF